MARYMQTGRPALKPEDQKPYAVATRVNRPLRERIDKACQKVDMSTSTFLTDCILRRLKTLEL